MERSEPTLVPGWYKGASSNSASGGPSVNHHAKSSSHSEERSIALLSRNKSAVISSANDASRSLFFGEKSSSSLRRSSSSNGNLSHNKDNSISRSRIYSNFGRTHHREKDSHLRAKERLLSLDNGFCDYSDSFMSSRNGDNLRRSNSMLSGRSFEPGPRKPVKDLSNGVHSGVINKASFERDFPNLRAEEKHGSSSISRVSSHGPSTGTKIGDSAIFGSENWTSALVELPVKVGDVGPAISFALPTAPVSLASIPISTGLTMAKTIAHTTSNVHNPPQLLVDTQRIEELTRIQYSKLIPVTPSMHKISGSSSDKAKLRAAKGGDTSAPPPKVGPQSSQLAAQLLRAPTRSDSPKTSQSGNFQVLNRERNITHTPNPSSSIKVMTAPLTSSAPTSEVPPPKTPLINNLKVSADGKRGVQALNRGGFGEKGPLSQAQNRYDFFNSLRKKSANSSSTSLYRSSSGSSVSSSASREEAKDFVLNSVGESSLENVNGGAGNLGGCEHQERYVADDVDNKGPETLIDPEEAAFLRSLGWEESAGEEALTAEEIDSFFEKYVKLNPSSEQCRCATERTTNTEMA